MRIKAPHSWALVLMSVILATQEAEIRRMTVRSQPRQISSQEPISKRNHTKRAGEVAQGTGSELKAQALSSSPSTTQKRKRKERERERRKRALGYIWRA
jgi:hypothetical protein